MGAILTKDFAMTECKLKIDDLGLRSTNSALLQNGPHTTLEIVKWEYYNSSCFTVAYWIRNNEGRYSLNFVGDRPFDGNINFKIFWMLAKFGQNLLDNEIFYI